jgi:ketosteroid isomerase-like protein
MTQAEQKERARRFLENFNQADPKVFAELITPNFTFAIMSGLKEFQPVSGRDNFAHAESAALKRLFPEGLGLKLDMILSDGPHVVALGAADTIAAKGRRYQQRYAFYLRFEGDLIAEGREYNDTNLVREVFLT